MWINNITEFKGKKSHDHLTTLKKKAFDKIQNLFMLKFLKRLGIQVVNLNIIKPMYIKPIANFKLNGEELKAIPLKSGTKQGCPLSLYQFNILLEVLAKSKIQLKEINWIQIGKEDVKVSVLIDKIMADISHFKNSTRELLQLVKAISKMHRI